MIWPTALAVVVGFTLANFTWAHFCSHDWPRAWSTTYDQCAVAIAFVVTHDVLGWLRVA